MSKTWNLSKKIKLSRTKLRSPPTRIEKKQTGKNRHIHTVAKQEGADAPALNVLRASAADSCLARLATERSTSARALYLVLRRKDDLDPPVGVSWLDYPTLPA